MQRSPIEDLLHGRPNSKRVQFLRSILVSNASFLLDYALCLLFVGGLGLDYLVSTALSFTAGTSLNYLLSIRWVFEGDKDGRTLEFALFLAISLVGLALNGLGMYLLTGLCRVRYFISRPLVATTVFLFNYYCKKYLLFGLAHRGRRG
jgi:Predicted membrane protein